MDWGHFGNWGGKRLCGFALTLCWSRMQYVEFTQRQDAETLLNAMVACVRVLRRRDPDGIDGQHDDGGAGPGRWAAAFSSQSTGLRQLLWLRAQSMPPSRMDGPVASLHQTSACRFSSVSESNAIPGHKQRLTRQPPLPLVGHHYKIPMGGKSQGDAHVESVHDPST